MKLQSATERAFCAAFFFLPISKPMLFASLLAAFLLFFAGGGMLDAMRSWRTLPWLAPALILAALPLVSLAVHNDLQAGLDSINLAYYWLFAILVFLASSRLPILPWLRAFLCGLFVVLCYSLLDAAGLHMPSVAPSGLANYILYSQLLAVGIVLLSILYKHETRGALRNVYLAAMAVFLIALASGKGRSGMLAVLVLLPLIIGNLFERLSRAKILLACAIAAVALLMSPMVQTRIEAAVNDLQLLQQNVTQTSLGYRVEMWQTALDVFRAHPLLGDGPWGFRNAWHGMPRSGEGLGFVEPHNAFLFFASSYGLAGLAALVWLYAALLWTGWRYRQSLEGAVVFSFAVICIFGSLTNTMFIGAVSHAWVMLFIGLQGALPQAPFQPAMQDSLEAARQ